MGFRKIPALLMKCLRGILFSILLGGTVGMVQASTVVDRPKSQQQGVLQLHVIFNNVPHRSDLRTAWGFACLIEGLDRTLLFDTGGNGDILLANMRRLGLDPRDVDAVALSHIHGDHVGGLPDLLAVNPEVTLYVPESFPPSFRRDVAAQGAEVETVKGPEQLFPGVYSTGQMGWPIQEQGILVDSPQGPVLLTGCAHPNVADMAEQATRYRNRKIHLLMGGFHLGSRREAEIRTIIERLQALGVEKVAPSHCTGNRAIRMFREAWGKDFIDGGLGAEITIRP